MKEIVLGIIGVILGLSIVANAALIYSAYNNGESIFGIDFSRSAPEETTQEVVLVESDTPVTETVSASQPKSGLAMYTNARMPVELGDNLYKSVHSMVYDNEAVFYIAYSNEVAGNEAGLNRQRADSYQIPGELWVQNLNKFIAKNKEFSNSLERYDSDAYATFFIVDDDDHERILAIISDGALYYDYTQHGGTDPFSLYNTRWNKYIRRDLSELLDNPGDASLPKSTQKTATQTNATKTDTAPEQKEILLDSRSYFYDDGSSSYGLLVVTNNSDKTVSVRGNGRVMDKDGNIKASDRSVIETLGPKETSAMKFYFDGVTGGDHLDYNMNYNVTDRAPVLSNLRLEENKLDDRVIMTMKNTGNTPIRFVEAYAVFLDKDNKVLKIDSNYQVDPNREIQPGATFSTQITCDEKFDSVQTFVYGAYTP